MSGDGEMATQARVTILGDEYPIKGDVDDATTKQVVEYVNDRIDEVKTMSRAPDKVKIAVLSALNIAGELFEYRSQTDDAKQRLEELEDRIERLTKKIDGALK